MFETYRMLGRERELELEAEAARLRPLAGRPLLRKWPRTSTEKDTQRKERTMSITRLITRFRIYPAAIVAVLVSVVLVGPAAAEVWPDGRDGAKLSTEASYANAGTRMLAPDDVRRMLPSRSATFPDFVDRYVESHRTAPVPTDRSAVLQTGEGFDWGAAGIGASTTAALLLVLAVGIGITRRTRARSAVA
jgi:hypothetical protein